MSYSKKTVAELRMLAAEKGIVNAADMKKKDLVELLENIELMMQSKSAETDKTGQSNSEESVASRPKRAAGRKSDVKKSDEKKSDVKKPDNRKNDEKNSDEMKGETSKKSFGKKTAGRTVRTPDKDESQDENVKTSDERAKASDERAKPSDERTKASDERSKISDEDAVKAEDDAYEAEQETAPDYINNGILEILPEGYGFLRSDNYMPGTRDVYLAPTQIRKFRLKTGDVVSGPIKKSNSANDKYSGLLYIDKVNGMSPEEVRMRTAFEDLTPVFPDQRIKLDYDNAPRAIRIVDFFSPIGKGQRGMIVSPPKAGKTTLLKQIAKRITSAYPDMNLLVLLIDERPEEVTDIKEAIEGPNAEVIYSTFDELPEHHKRVSEMVIERAKRLVECKKDVVILIDSITRLARAYNLTVTASGRTLSGGLDPAALHMPKKFFGAARNMREGGSLTILATALIETGSRMDDVVFEEFKGTGNMELVLDRSLSEKRIFPAIDIPKSGTRRDDLLLDPEEKAALDLIHSNFRGNKTDEIVEEIVKLFAKTKNNREFIDMVNKIFRKY